MNDLIRDAREGDLPRLAEIERECFSVPWTVDMLRSQFSPGQHVFLVAEKDGEAAGYIGLAYVLDEGYISNVAVAPAFRRRGVGDALLDGMEARGRALALAFLTLEVRESNAPARALYAKHGYRDVGRRKNYYEKPREDAILMTKELEA
ncbi:MAG: ribosomal protein S18-alanine N-acetyltransferase [Oscillospiraceae bacterium]|nr:ribosomal protein S18-alanine N-acetyltransferase [Oscillospiraceae bacterium]